MLQYLKTQVGSFPNAYIAYNFFFILIIIVCIDRNLSKLKLIKTNLQLTTLQKKIELIERDVIEQLVYSNLINIFTSKIAKQIALGGLLKKFQSCHPIIIKIF